MSKEKNSVLPFVTLGAVSKKESTKEFVFGLSGVKEPHWTDEEIFLFRYFHIIFGDAKQKLESISSFGEMLAYAKQFDFNGVRNLDLSYVLPISVVTTDPESQKWLMDLEDELDLSADEVFVLRSELANQDIYFNSDKCRSLNVKLLEILKHETQSIIGRSRK